MSLNGVAEGAPFDTTADAVLGQPDFASIAPNPPESPTASSLALNFAPHVALAPDGRIYVSDADNHRVLSWPNAAAFANHAPADRVIGQPNFTSNALNRGQPVGANGFNLPQGLCIDNDGNFWVADALNHRVLRFPDGGSNGVADLVVGQPDFSSNASNLGMGDDDPDTAAADSLAFPGRVIARGNDLWISDSGNSRVLHYTAPTANKPSADLVLGQYGDFTRRAMNNDGSGLDFGPPSADNLFNCIGIAFDAYNNLYVADWLNHRVLRFDDPLTNDTTADAVIGQPDFASSDPNQGGAEAGLQMPADIFVDHAGGLYVADSANHRVLVYHDPLFDTSMADAVYGQLGSFTAAAPNHGLGIETSDADGLFAPTGVAADAALNLFVVDANNHRVLRFDSVRPPTAAADFDLDGDVDAGDYARMAGCLGGPSVDTGAATCRVPDLDGDADVDLGDFARMQRCFGGEGVPASANCAD